MRYRIFTFIFIIISLGLVTFSSYPSSYPASSFLQLKVGQRKLFPKGNYYLLQVKDPLYVKIQKEGGRLYLYGLKAGVTQIEAFSKKGSEPKLINLQIFEKKRPSQTKRTSKANRPISKANRFKKERGKHSFPPEKLIIKWN
jgi:Flp pilus assembly secretin CpaC